MKWLKLFEQFEDEEPWWDEESPFDVIKDLRIVSHMGAAGDYYLLKEIKPNGNVILFDDDRYDYPQNIFDLNPKFNEKYDLIGICYKNNNDTKRYQYNDLPTEIKDRVIL